ncbi:hypothetical protein BJ165DRAFT_1533930 [Panaeolus papilionaceus]|nr:hypothetical protein BJ165DRAFT_1533930 [Panaeolus papilionaceus]
MELSAIYEISGETRTALKLPSFHPLVIGSRKKCKIGPTIPSSGTPAPSTTEDPTTTSLFAEAKSLNMSEVKPSTGVKPRLTPTQLRALEVEKEKEAVRGGGGTMRLGGNVEGARSVLAEQPDFVVEQARKLITTASIQQRASQDSSRNRRERA